MVQAPDGADARFAAGLREFFTTEIDPQVRAQVAAGRSVDPQDLRRTQATLADAGLAVPAWPVRWGGRDWTALQRHLWLAELQTACVPEPLPFNAGMVGPVIAQFGSEELKERFLPATARLDIWWAQGFSEPDAGSDLASLTTTAVRDGADYVVTGQKTWTTLGQHADWIFALVRTDPQAPRRQAGISFLLIDLDSPGVTVRPIELIDGGREVNEVFFDQVRVPAENLVGEENAGWSYAKFLLGNERVGIARVAASQMRLARAIGHAGATPWHDRTRLDDPLIRARIAELRNDLLALETTQLRVVADSADGRPSPASSVLKLRGSELQQAVTELELDLAGATGLPADPPALVQTEEWAGLAAMRYLNHRKVSIYSGSNEIQRTIIAGTILGL